MDEGECPGGCGWVPRLCKCQRNTTQDLIAAQAKIARVKTVLTNWGEYYLPRRNPEWEACLKKCSEELAEALGTTP